MFDFLKYGKFDYIKPGQTKEWILNNFPDPDDFDESMLNKRFRIWTYGGIEFHFNDDKLYMIYSDHFHDFNGGKYLKLDKWIFEDIAKLTLSYVLTQLNNHDIDYQKRSDQWGVCLNLTNGVSMTFGNVSEMKDLTPNDFRITSVSISE